MLEAISQDKHLKKYMEEKGGKLKCFPMSYMQSNYAFYYSQRNAFLDECLSSASNLKENYSSVIENNNSDDEETF